MTSSPLVSVVIPTYNRAYILRRAIDSVLQQTYPNIEVIVVDDGSTDETQALLRDYSTRVRVVYQRNSGPSKARNAGIAAATGQILAFLDSDDCWLPTKIARQVNLLEILGDSVPCCICNCRTVYNDGTSDSTFRIAGILPGCSEGLWLNPAEVLTTRFVIFSQAIAIRREVLETIGSYDENLPFFCEDHELALRLALAGPWAILRDELVLCQDAGPGSLGQQALRQEVRLRTDLLYMRRRLFDLVNRTATGRNLRRLARIELSAAKRDLLAARLANQGSWVAASFSRIIRIAERIRRSLFRRSPLFPKVSVRPVVCEIPRSSEAVHDRQLVPKD